MTTSPPPLPPYLSDVEIREMCEPLTQPAAMCRFLLGKGLLVTTKPNGRPLVLRSELDRVLGAGRFAAGFTAPSHSFPDMAALRSHLSKRGQHGTQA